MQELATKEFTLRHFRKGDEAAIIKHANNPKIYRATIAMPHPYIKKDAREWIEMCRQEAGRRRPGLLSLAIDSDGEVIGCVGLSDIDGHKAGIGYWLAEPYWGQGIMTRAVQITTDLGFDEFGLVRIYAHVFPFNKASMRILEKAGYMVEGLLRKEALKDGEYLDMYLMAKVH